MSLSSQQPEKQGKRSALIVGVNMAPHSMIAPLLYAEDSAREMADLLGSRCRFDVVSLYGEQASSRDIQSGLRQMVAGASKEDFLLFYFCGHGLPVYDTTEPLDAQTALNVYLVSHDFRRDEIEYRREALLSIKWLRRFFYNHDAAGTVLVILDNCYSGDVARVGDDERIGEVLAKVHELFGYTFADTGTNPKSVRVFLTSTSANQKAFEAPPYACMTGHMVQALKGEIDEVYDKKGITLSRIYEYAASKMPFQQIPRMLGSIEPIYLVSDAAHRTPPRTRPTEAPKDFILVPHVPFYQQRQGEFKELEGYLFNTGARPSIVGIVGRSGIGKTQLAAEIANRSTQICPEGVFWLTARGQQFFDWQQCLAELAWHTHYLPANDDPMHPENEARRAHQMSKYLAEHRDALLIIDNIEEPEVAFANLFSFIGGPPACAILYTSHSHQQPAGAVLYKAKGVTEDGSLRLLLQMLRPQVLQDSECGRKTSETEAAEALCRQSEYIPLHLLNLRGLLARDAALTVSDVLQMQGGKDRSPNFKPLTVPTLPPRDRLSGEPQALTDSDIYLLNWQELTEKHARNLFILASCFPEAAAIPLWLLSLAAGFDADQQHPDLLQQTIQQLQELNLLLTANPDYVRMHPLARQFGQQQLQKDIRMNALLVEARMLLLEEFTTLHCLEQRAQKHGYWQCLEQLRAAREYLAHLDGETTEELERVEHWFEREAYLFTNRDLWPSALPGLLYQQLYNRSVEEQHPFNCTHPPAQWIQQMTASGAEEPALLNVLRGHTRAVTSLAFSSDGRLLSSASQDGTVCLWEAHSGRLLGTFRGGSKRALFSVCFAPDGRLMAVGGEDRNVWVWEIASRKVVEHFEDHQAPVLCVAFSPDGQWLASSSDDQVVLRSLTDAGEVWHVPGSRIECFSFSQDGNYLLVGSGGGTARLWSVQTRTVIPPPLEGHEGSVRSVAFSVSGTQAVTGSYKAAHMWALPEGTRQQTLLGHEGWVYVAISADGATIITGAEDRNVRLWRCADGSLQHIFWGHQDPVRSIACSPDGSRFATASNDQTIRMWRYPRQEHYARLQPAEQQRILSVAFSPDGARLLTGSDDYRARLWDVEKMHCLLTLSGHEYLVRSVAFSPDGTLLVTGSDDTTVRVWDAASGHEHVVLRGHRDQVLSMAFSWDGSTLATASADRTIRLWKMQGGVHQHRYTLEGHRGSVHSVAFSQDGRLLLTGSEDCTVRLWNTDNGKERLAFKSRHKSSVTAVALNHTIAIIGEHDGSVSLCRLEDGSRLTVLPGHLHEITLIAFSPDNQLVLTADTSGLVRFWRFQGSEPTTELRGLYTSAYQIGAYHWQSRQSLLFADKDIPLARPHLYQLHLERL